MIHFCITNDLSLVKKQYKNQFTCCGYHISYDDHVWLYESPHNITLFCGILWEGDIDGILDQSIIPNGQFYYISIHKSTGIISGATDFLEDYTTDEFKQKAAETIQKQSQDAEQAKQLEQKKAMAESALAEANVVFTHAQTKNTQDDNSKQLAVSIDKHFQEWADLAIKATKEGAQLPEHPNYAQIITMAKQILQPPQQQPQPQQQGE